MSTPDPSLVLLTAAGDNAEASAIRGLLEANGIQTYVQGEQHRSMLGMLGAYIELRVLVPASDLERARELLEAEAGPEDAELPTGSAPAEGEVCAVHQAAANGICERCGAFLCDACAVADRAHPVCESCEERTLPAPGARSRKRRVLGLVVIGILTAPMVIIVGLRLLQGIL